MRFKFFAHILLAVMAIPPIGHAQDLLGIDGEEATSIGVFIKDLESGEVLYDFNSELALTPASVMKSITTATALSLLNQDFCYSTPVELRGSVSAKSWRGNLVVVSSGDPTIESENFASNLGFCDSICSAIKRLGINNIEGKIIVEQTLSDAGPIAQWEIEDVAWPYGAGLYGFNFRDNICTVTPLTGQTKPYVPGLEIEVIENKDANDLIRGIGSNKLTVYARNMNNKKWSLGTTVPDPTAVFVYQMTEMLNAAGIKIENKDISTAAAERCTIYTHRSPSAPEIYKSLMVRSDNMFAEGTLRSIAPGQSRKAAITLLKELWSNRGVDSKCSIILDGSGLTRGNRLQPRFIADVLEWMVQSPLADTYVSFFPRAGLDGTMSAFLDKTPLKGRIAMKTGSMNAVQCYAGYHLDENNKPTHIIVIMVNGFFCPRAQLRKSIEQLLIDTFV